MLEWVQTYLANLHISDSVLISESIGVLLLALAFYLILKTRQFVANAIRLVAVVQSYDTRESWDGWIMSTIVLRYVIDANPYEHSTNGVWGYIKRGSEVEILYDSMNPADVRINRFFYLWGSSLMLCFTGIAFIVVGLNLA